VKTIEAADFATDPAGHLRAASDEPIVITREGRVRAYVFRNDPEAGTRDTLPAPPEEP
jgi:hypothetical protein